MFLLADKGKGSLQQGEVVFCQLPFQEPSLPHSLIQQGSSSSYVESLLDECVEDVGKEKDLYAKLARIKSKNKNRFKKRGAVNFYGGHIYYFSISQ